MPPQARASPRCVCIATLELRPSPKIIVWCAGTLSGSTWALLCARSFIDVLFNFLIALGLALTHPLFVSIGTLLSTPLNILVVWASRYAAPTALECAGAAVVCLGFCLLLLDDRAREQRLEAGRLRDACADADDAADE